MKRATRWVNMGCPILTGGEVWWGSFRGNVLNFQVKMQGFRHFYCEKLLVVSNRDQGFNRTPGGLKMQNTWGLEILAGGLTVPTPPVYSHPACMPS